MGRTAQIHYQRVTFSFPAKVIEKLRSEIGQNNMSKYVVDLVEENLANKKEENIDEFFKSLDELSERIKANRRDKRSSVEILREIRYGKK